MPADVRLEYDQKLYYVTITFSVSEDMKESMPIPGGYEQAGWLYTFVPQPKLTSAGFVLGKMDNDTSESYIKYTITQFLNIDLTLVQLCCGGWGDVNLPLEADDIESYVKSMNGKEPVPDWLFETLRILVENGSPKFKPLKIRTSALPIFGSLICPTDASFIKQGPCSNIQYHKVRNLPANFVAVGDSVLQLNPIYA